MIYLHVVAIDYEGTTVYNVFTNLVTALETCIEQNKDTDTYFYLSWADSQWIAQVEPNQEGGADVNTRNRIMSWDWEETLYNIKNTNQT